MIELDRRMLLGNLGTASVLAPFLAVERAMAQHAGHTPSGDPSQEEMMAAHQRQMTALFGDNLRRDEQIAMLLYPGFTALDLVGPQYFFACLFGATVHLVTTEANLAPVASDLGLAVQPTISMADMPANLDVLFVPGGTNGTLGIMGRPDVMGFIEDRASRARYITSVCTGSLVLAKAGLLRGKRATGHWAVRSALSAFGATPVDARVVRDGNIVTGAGVSAGLDYAIVLVEMLRGRAYAETLVLQAEYDPEPTIRAGRPEEASAAVREMMETMFAPLQAKFAAMAP
jgi:putative intracellular protease/amidase